MPILVCNHLAEHARIQKVLPEGFQLWQGFCLCVVFLLRRERIRNSTKGGPLSVHQQNVILMSFHWRANDGPTFAGSVALRIFRGSGLVLLRNHNVFFVIFRGVRTPCPPPPLWIRACWADCFNFVGVSWLFGYVLVSLSHDTTCWSGIVAFPGHAHSICISLGLYSSLCDLINHLFG